MTVFFALLTAVSAIWIAFEIWLMLRDRLHGRGKTKDDRGSRYFNLIAIAVGIMGAALTNGYLRFFFPGGRSDTVFAIGLAIMLLGLGLRIWAVVTLGASFRTTVETHDAQKVVRRGPYKLIRHPSYSGLLLMCCGYGIAVQNWLSLAIAVLLPLAALLYRIHIEEAAMVSSMGSDYSEYRKNTKKLLPWVW
jgi:protein-S-isoprenylcysteine O-methyltransferase Ste14